MPWEESLFGFRSVSFFVPKETADLVAMWKKDASDMGNWDSCIS